MKKIILPIAALFAMLFLSGCIIGTGGRTVNHNPTLGQQLVDLKTARERGAINDSEYETQKAKLLAGQSH